MRVLVFMGSYLPGMGSAGVTVSISNMVKELNPDVEFYIITADRDHGDVEPYNNVLLEQWTKFGDANVFYSARYSKELKYFKDIINKSKFDAYYVNGFYNYTTNFRLLWLYLTKQIPQKPLIVAPRGIFSLGKYDNKQVSRWCYRKMFCVLGLVKKIIWHATADFERQHILNLFPKVGDNIYIIPNITNIDMQDRIVTLAKVKGKANVMFISRISEKKNIKQIIKALSMVRGEIQMNFYGMIGGESDLAYWNECKVLIESLPSNVHCTYHGEVSHDQVKRLFMNHHLFFFPTFGENYGHVIAESLACGCPVLLSDMTPWNMLREYGGGWNYGVYETDKYANALQQIVDMNQEDWRTMSNNALRIAKDNIETNKVRQSYREFFSKIATL